MQSLALPRGRTTRRSMAVRLTSLVNWERLALLAILAASAVLSLYHLDRLGYGNAYYAATVRSMSQNWHAFFFGSYDSAGFVTVDKPPLGLWVQTAFAKLFGFHGFVLLLPQALAMIGSVALVYHLVRRSFGAGAGLFAAAAMAVTPIGVAIARSNNLDMLLVFTLLLATWAVLKATETGRLRWLLLSAALVGLGFNIKMLQAYLVVPAFGLLYLLAAPVSFRRRIGHLALAGVVLVAVSLSWAIAVDLTPADQRPYIGSSESNSALDLALGYNGIQRLLGRDRGDGGDGRATVPQFTAAPANGQATPGAVSGDAPVRVRADGGGPGGGGPGGQGENGDKGVLRLFNQQLGGQIAWLLPLALLGMVAAWSGRFNIRRDRRQQSVVLWGTWLLTAAAFFSVAGFYHRYYLVMLAAPVAALAAAGVSGLWRHYRAGGWRIALLPLAIVATAAVQWHILGDYPTWRDRLAPWLLGGTAVLVLALFLAAFLRPLRDSVRPWVFAAAGMVALLAAPATWAWTTVDGSTNATLPAAGPSERGGFGGSFAPPGATARRPGDPPTNARQFPGNRSGTASPGAGVPGAAPGPDRGAGVPGDNSGADPGTGIPGAAPGIDSGSGVLGAVPGANAGAGAPDAAPGANSGADPGVGAPSDAPVTGAPPTGNPPTGQSPVGGPGGEGSANAQLIAYLQANRGDTNWLVAVPSSMAGSSIIIATGEPVMAMGGFSGGDPILDAESVAKLVADGDIRFFLLGGGGGPGGGSASATGWVTSTCASVPASTYAGTSTGAATTGRGGFGSQLYDCAGATG